MTSNIVNPEVINIVYNILSLINPIKPEHFISAFSIFNFLRCFFSNIHMLSLWSLTPRESILARFTRGAFCFSPNSLGVPSENAYFRARPTWICVERGVETGRSLGNEDELSCFESCDNNVGSSMSDIEINALNLVIFD